MAVVDKTIAHVPEITEQLIERFLSGHNPQEGITSIECDYRDKYATITSFDKEGRRSISYDEFYPFVWCKLSAAKQMRINCAKKGIDISDLMRRYGIFCDQLALTNETGQHFERIDNGYTLLFYAVRCMSFSDFLIFFRMTGVPVYGGKKKKAPGQIEEKNFIAISPVEQHMIRTGKRLFKGFDNYDDIPRGFFDLETTGLDPHHCMLSQFGVRTNKGFEKIFGVEGETEEERFTSELDAIIGGLTALHDLEVSVLSGHNSESFDWNFLDVRLFYHGTSLRALTQAIWGNSKPGIYKDEKEATLKLGGEVEHYRPTKMQHTSIVDSMHAVRRAMASDSDIENAGLKYITKFIKANKKNRVYIKGDQIQHTWLIKEKAFAFNNENGDWYRVSDKKPLKDGYEMVSGRYIAERYLLDDLYETDKVELRFNESNFLINKFLPTTFTRACTMGTAGIWKLIIYAWYYENKLAIPKPGSKKRYVGGLSRLLCVGVVKNQAKLDYNSLYPSIMITWKVETPIDITHILLPLLNYVLTKREYYKGLKGKYGDMADELDAILAGFVGTQVELNELQTKQNEYKGLKVANDKKQLPFKTLGNSIYGSLGAVDFPLSDCDVAEKVTCIGRQCLRLMIHHFTNMGGGPKTPFSYMPIVGDSFTGDTPLFIKYEDTGLVDIKPIKELIDESMVKTDDLGREYDMSVKPYYVLCRSGWQKPSYVYRHKNTKAIYEVTDGNARIDVTQDHSLFDSQQRKIKPGQITENTQLEYYKKPVVPGIVRLKANQGMVKAQAKQLASGELDRVPCEVLNAGALERLLFLKTFAHYKTKGFNYSKTCEAGLQFLNR